MGWLDRYLCPLAALAEQAGAVLVITVLLGMAGGGLLGTGVVRLLSRLVRAGHGSFAPGWLAATLIATVAYPIGVLVDPLLKSTVDPPPAAIPEEAWARIGFFEWKLLGDWSWPILPLTEHPAAGIVIHLAFWIVAIVLVRALLLWIHRHDHVTWNTPQTKLPWYYRWVGSSTARRADHRFVHWSKRLVYVAWPLYLLCGYLMANESMSATRRVPQCVADDLLTEAGLASAAGAFMGSPIEGAPAPGAWVLGGLLLFGLSVHFILEGSPPAEREKEKDDEEEPLPGPPPDPLRRLGDALQARYPGAFLEALEQHPASEAETAGFRDGESPLVAEAFAALAGEDTSPYVHQREVLDHLRAVWTMTSPEASGASPELREEAGPSPIRRADLSTPHALVLAPEGSGRTTLTCLSALYVHLDRGATTLVITRDARSAKAWATRLREALLRSSARWNVQVVLAGEDLAEAFLAGRTPAVVVAGLDELEADVLGAPRTDAFFASLGLVVAEDVDGFVGVPEMHLHMVMRRVWTLLDTVHDAPYPPVLLATLGPSANGMEAWARHVLAAPMRVFARDGAPRLARGILRRRDLADAHGEPIPLAQIAEACEAAEVPWHVRRAGDGARHLERAETDLGHLRRHHRPDPLDAEVVLIEGTHPDVRREAERLAHAGIRTARDSVVLVLAPPADEEMVLHQEAQDAPHRALIESLPRAVPLAEPDVVRQRHFDRALGREQDVAALRARFGVALTDEVLGRLEKSRRVRFREVWEFDARADDAVSRRLVRAAGESALGEPIRSDCVSETSARVRLVDRGTSEVLREVDQAVAATLYPPGAIFEHPRGRYAVLEGEARAETGNVPCEQVTEPHRTTPERAVTLELPVPRFEARELGGLAVRVATGDVRVEETVHRVRRYAPGPKLVEERRYPTPLRSSYSTEACVIATALAGAPLSAEAAAPLAAALRLVAPCALRGAHELLDVALIEHEGERCFALFDRTPGSSGYARFVAESALGDLLQLARLVLERLVGPVQRRLHRIHDTSVDGDPEGWDTREALSWIDAVLDPPPGVEGVEDELDRRRRIEYVPGEGRGDLGRLWISSTGRTDDLVWTRHAFRSAHPLGDQPAGRVFLDVAIERRTIAWAIRKAITAGAARGVLPITDPTTWMKQHHAALSTASQDLSALYERLFRLSGAHLVETVLALVAGIPTHPEPIPVAERAPVAVLARRRADRDAKCLLAWALLPTAVSPTVRLTEQGPVLQITEGGTTRVVDLSGDAIRSLEGDTGSALALSWGDEAPPEEAAEASADEASPDEAPLSERP